MLPPYPKFLIAANSPQLHLYPYRRPKFYIVVRTSREPRRPSLRRRDATTIGAPLLKFLMLLVRLLDLIFELRIDILRLDLPGLFFQFRPMRLQPCQLLLPI